MRCAGRRLQGAVIFQKIRDTRRQEGVRGVVSWESDKKSTNARKTSYSTDVGVLPSVRENLSVLTSTPVRSLLLLMQKTKSGRFMRKARYADRIARLKEPVANKLEPPPAW